LPDDHTIRISRTYGQVLQWSKTKYLRKPPAYFCFAAI
jgi:hypothetical protein